MTENDQLGKKDTTVAISLQRTFTGLNWTQDWKDDQKRLNKPIMALFELNYYFKRLLQYLQEPFRHLLQSVSPNRGRTTTQIYPVWFWNSMRLFWKFNHFELHLLEGVCLELKINCLVFLYFSHLFLTKSAICSWVRKGQCFRRLRIDVVVVRDAVYPVWQYVVHH